jgi:mannose-6-phosphate isomerase-like protein (cupin superfamily)
MNKINTLTMAEEEGLVGTKYGAIGNDVFGSVGRGWCFDGSVESTSFRCGNFTDSVWQDKHSVHAHNAQWEFYHVIEGKVKVRDDGGITPIEKGDAFLFKQGEAHQIINDADSDFVV